MQEVGQGQPQALLRQALRAQPPMVWRRGLA
jgi:hypothetical protein